MLSIINTYIYIHTHACMHTTHMYIHNTCINIIHIHTHMHTYA